MLYAVSYLDYNFKQSYICVLANSEKEAFSNTHDEINDASSIGLIVPMEEGLNPFEVISKYIKNSKYPKL